jgi:hypothetical protein
VRLLADSLCRLSASVRMRRFGGHYEHAAFLWNTLRVITGTLGSWSSGYQLFRAVGTSLLADDLL